MMHEYVYKYLCGEEVVVSVDDDVYDVLSCFDKQESKSIIGEHVIKVNKINDNGEKVRTSAVVYVNPIQFNTDDENYNDEYDYLKKAEKKEEVEPYYDNTINSFIRRTEYEEIKKASSCFDAEDLELFVDIVYREVPLVPLGKKYGLNMSKMRAWVDKILVQWMMEIYKNPQLEHYARMIDNMKF